MIDKNTEHKILEMQSVLYLIASEPLELSHDKIKCQRDYYKKIARECLDKNWYEKETTKDIDCAEKFENATLYPMMIPSWVEKLYQVNNDENHLCILMDGIEELLKQYNLAIIDEILITTQWDKLSPLLIIAICRSTFCAKNVLNNWCAAAQLACNELKKRNLNIQSLMIGLVDKDGNIK